MMRCFSRIREVAKDDLVGLHLRLRRSLWTLSWDQLCLSCWDSLLVLHQIVQETLSWESEIRLIHVWLSICSMWKCIQFFLIYWWCLVSWFRLWISFESVTEILLFRHYSLGTGRVSFGVFFCWSILSFETPPFKRLLVSGITSSGR